jgi:glycosyltransferase involved in cell wall biosynthesis
VDEQARTQYDDCISQREAPIQADDRSDQVFQQPARVRLRALGVRPARPAADVVLFAPFAGPFYGGEGQAGGAELQSYYLARWLARSGLRVRHLVDGGSPMRSPDGVEVLPLPPDVHKRGLARRRAILGALHDADGRVYIQRSAGIATALVAIFAKATGRRSVFSASSDGDFTRDPAMLSQMGGSLEQRHVRIQYQLGVRSVDAVVTQTRHQTRLARNSFRLEPNVIHSFSVPAPHTEKPREAFLWIGSLTDVKDPHSFLALVECLPDVRFWMVSHTHATRWRHLATEVRARATRLPNLELLPRLPREELFDLYSRSIAFVNTSRFEGFPNTFLEAWANGTPVVSLRIDPDGVIARHRLGAVAGGSLELATQAVLRYASDRAAARIDGEAGRRYIARTHAPEVVGPRWFALVEDLMAR